MSNKNRSGWSEIDEDEAFPPWEMIQQQLNKIISSTEFHATQQQREFLTFVVMETVAGRGADLKGYTIATQVFGRSEDFSASVDPIVSIQANKLRRALERYYLIDGKFDPFRIDIPKGGYTPTCVRQNTIETQHNQDSLVEETGLENGWPILLILPFKNLTGDSGLDCLGSGISSELAIEVSRFETIRVIYPRDGITKNDKYVYSRFVLNGELYKKGDGLKLVLSLIDKQSGIQIWGDTRQTGRSFADLHEFGEQIALNIATTVCGEFGVITRSICKETRNKSAEELSTYETIARFWEYEQNTTPETFERAFTALTHTVKREPDCCLTLGALAIMYGTIHSLDIPGFDNPLERSVQYAEKAATLNPNNQRILAILAYARLISNELTAAVNEAHRALELNPQSLFVLDGLAWILTLAGDWEHGPRLAQKSIESNPFHRAIAHDALWVNHMRQGEYDLAFQEACSHQRSNMFWDPLMKASSLGLAGKKEEGKKWADELLALRQDFPEKGRLLIGNFIKFEEIQERILKGLSRSGLKVDSPVSS